MISKRILEELEKRLDTKSKFAPIFFYTVDNFGRCFLTNMNLELPRKAFKTKKSMFKYIETIYNRNDIIYICDDIPDDE